MVLDTRQMPILVAEDDADDRSLLQRALQAAKVPNPISYVKDGQELLDFLGSCAPEGEGRATHSSPALILLDLNMPRMNGKEALKLMRQDKRFERIPVLVLTTSRSREDILQSYSLGANSFMTKPLSYGEFVGMAELIRLYWLEKVELPGQFQLENL